MRCQNAASNGKRFLAHQFQCNEQGKESQSDRKQRKQLCPELVDLYGHNEMRQGIDGLNNDVEHDSRDSLRRAPLASDHEGVDRVFARVVVARPLAVVDVTRQFGPLVAQVDQCAAELAGRRDDRQIRQQQTLDVSGHTGAIPGTQPLLVCRAGVPGSGPDLGLDEVTIDSALSIRGAPVCWSRRCRYRA